MVLRDIQVILYNKMSNSKIVKFKVKVQSNSKLCCKCGSLDPKSVWLCIVIQKESGGTSHNILNRHLHGAHESVKEWFTQITPTLGCMCIVIMNKMGFWLSLLCKFLMIRKYNPWKCLSVVRFSFTNDVFKKKEKVKRCNHCFQLKFVCLSVHIRTVSITYELWATRETIHSIKMKVA